VLEEASCYWQSHLPQPKKANGRLSWFEQAGDNALSACNPFIQEVPFILTSQQGCQSLAEELHASPGAEGKDRVREALFGERAHHCR
jgi:hypothetical protein